MTFSTNQKLEYLKIMGIQCFEPKKNSPMENINQWAELQRTVASCTACALCHNRTQTVFGVGNKQANLMLIGEAPGFYEDQKGEPFVGRAGQLLNAMLDSIGLKRDSVYIANILKCRPPDNRDPLPEEVALCTPFLKQQIDLIKPTLLLALGRIAGQFLLNSKESLGKLREKTYYFGELKTPLIITYHPAYLLRNPVDKSKTWQDLQRVLNILNAAPNN